MILNKFFSLRWNSNYINYWYRVGYWLKLTIAISLTTWNIDRLWFKISIIACSIFGEIIIWGQGHKLLIRCFIEQVIVSIPAMYPLLSSKSPRPRTCHEPTNHRAVCIALFHELYVLHVCSQPSVCSQVYCLIQPGTPLQGAWRGYRC